MFMDAVRRDMAVFEVTEEDADDRTKRRRKICSDDLSRDRTKEEDEIS